MNPPQPTTNYGRTGDQNLGQGSNYGNGTPDSFLDEVSTLHPRARPGLHPSRTTHQKCLHLGQGSPGVNQPVQQRRY